MAGLDLGDVEEAERWLDRAATAAAESPTPLRSRELEAWRGLTAATAGDAPKMREHFERALHLATEQGRAAARCQLLARLALESARLGAERGDEDLLTAAEQAATEARATVQLLSGHPPWAAQAEAALAEVALARGDLAVAAASARSATAILQSAMFEDLFPEILLPVARAALAAGEEEEKQGVTAFLRVMVTMVALRTLDEAIRVRWFRGPIGREFVRLIGPIDATAAETNGGAVLDDWERRALGLLTEGLTNGEIAGRLGVSEEQLELRLQEVFARIGASSRGEATAFALAEGVL
jgi:DNA-binding NarL/FixJ family response regulator